jgi:hypothetical protein
VWGSFHQKQEQEEVKNLPKWRKMNEREKKTKETLSQVVKMLKFIEYDI